MAPSGLVGNSATNLHWPPSESERTGRELCPLLWPGLWHLPSLSTACGHQLLSQPTNPPHPLPSSREESDPTVTHEWKPNKVTSGNEPSQQEANCWGGGLSSLLCQGCSQLGSELEGWPRWVALAGPQGPLPTPTPSPLPQPLSSS